MNQNSPIQVDGVREEDLPALRELFQITRITTFTWLPATSFQPDDFDKETEGEMILVARRQDRIIGFISIWMPDQFIHHLYVDPAYHGMSAGSVLLNSALAILNDRASLKCMVQNSHAIGFYRAYGFVESGRGKADDGEYIVFQYNRKQNNE